MSQGGDSGAAGQNAGLHLSYSFLESKLRLTPAVQRRIDETVLKLSRDPSNPGIGLERILSKKGKKPSNLWSARVNDDLRMILAKERAQTVVLFVGRHDEAYRWAEVRRAATHGGTGEFQIVLVPETPEVPIEVRESPRKSPLLRLPAKSLFEVGVPEEWLDVLLAISDEEELLSSLQLLPEGVGDLVYELMNGRRPQLRKRPDSEAEAFGTLTARQWLWTPESEQELTRVLGEPFEAWRLFLHPSQRALVELEASGPVKITGPAGTGKSVVAIHRAAYLARQGKRVLVLSYAKNLCASLERGLDKLLGGEARNRIKVSTVDSLARRVLVATGAAERDWKPLGDQDLLKLLQQHVARTGSKVKMPFLRLEWDRVVKLQGIFDWQSYSQAERSGRSQALGESGRREVWAVLGPFLEGLAKQEQASYAHLRAMAASSLVQKGVPPSLQFDAVIVDELQDLTPPALRLIAGLAANHPGNLMLIGDGGQRIYPGGFSLFALGIDVRGRSTRLRVNYRSTAQIQGFADRIRVAADDLDGGKEDTAKVRCLLEGRPPAVNGFEDEAGHDEFLLREIGGLLAQGLQLDEIGVFARHWSELERVQQVFLRAGIRSFRVDKDQAPGFALCSLHGAKGLEYRAVFVVRCDEGVVPYIDDPEILGDPVLLADETNCEVSMLYVGLTRAREKVVATWVGKPSPFIERLQAEPQEATA